MASPLSEKEPQKAVWEETNTALFLQILIEEIDMGNRPSGHFSRSTWARIASQFANASGDKYTITQLKNKYENMKKEFGIWEKLLHEESGLGYNHETCQIVADPTWWKHKIKERPEYRRFRTSGPMHLDLQEQVFRGMVATGYMQYVPAKYRKKTPAPGASPSQPFTPTTHNVPNPPEGCGYSDATTTAPIDALPLDTSDGKIKHATKRKRKSISSSKPSQHDINQNLMEFISVCKASEQSANNNINGDGGSGIGYRAAIQMLRSLTWLGPSDPLFLKSIFSLKDPLNRQGFHELIDLPEDFIRDYLEMMSRK